MFPVGYLNNKRNRPCAGFTLAELLIVVAIVAILVAIAIPVFISATKTAEEATCAANRRALKGMVVDSYLLNHGTQENLQTIFDSAYTNLKDQNGGKLCPTDGTYSQAGNIDEGIIIVKCSRHGLTAEEEIENWASAHGWSGVDDKVKRAEFAKAMGISSWTPAEGIGNNGKSKTYYIQFKTYKNSSAALFLYAGTDPNPNSTNPWNTRYICDSKGTLTGVPGQWYELPKETNIGYGTNSGEAQLKELLTSEGVKKVSLTNGKFEAAK